MNGSAATPLCTGSPAISGIDTIIATAPATALTTALNFSSRNSSAATRSRSACSSNAVSSGEARWAPYPVASIVETRPSGDTTAGLKRTVAVFIMRFTFASTTPGCFWSAACTREEQAAQVIPATGMRTDSSGSVADDAVVLMLRRVVVMLLTLQCSRLATGHEEVPVHPGNRSDPCNDYQPVNSADRHSSVLRFARSWCGPGGYAHGQAGWQS